jgi:hypothetical protein
MLPLLLQLRVWNAGDSRLKLVTMAKKRDIESSRLGDCGCGFSEVLPSGASSEDERDHSMAQHDQSMGWGYHSVEGHDSSSRSSRMEGQGAGYRPAAGGAASGMGRGGVAGSLVIDCDDLGGSGGFGGSRSQGLQSGSVDAASFGSAGQQQQEDGQVG